MPAPRRADAGFTLLELLVVLTLVALAVGLVASRVPTALTPQAVARDVAADLRQTRERAIAIGKPQSLAFDLSEGIYGGNDEADKRLPGGFQYRLRSVRDEENQERGMVRFFPDGSATGARFWVEGTNGTMLVGVDWLTGRVRVTREMSN